MRYFADVERACLRAERGRISVTAGCQPRKAYCYCCGNCGDRLRKSGICGYKKRAFISDGASSEQGAALRSFRRLSSETVMVTDKGDVTRTESEASDSAVTVKKRVYAGPGLGDCTVYMERITADSSSAGQTLTVFQLGEGQGTVRNYDITSKKWKTAALAEGTLPYGMYFIKTGSSESIFITPQAYRSRENGMVESVPAYNGAMRISKQDGRFYITVSVPALSQGMFCDFTALCSGSALVNWNDASDVSKWENYRFTDDNRWCYDGYYYKTPSNYIPSGTNYFYKLPAAHITGKMARNKNDAASRAFSLAMIDVMKARYNSSGYYRLKTAASGCRALII